MHIEYPHVAADLASQLAERAHALRMLILRTHAAAGQGHLGSSLSIVEILVALMSSGVETGSWGKAPHGDRIVLSKGHAALAFYCALAQTGLIPQRDLESFSRNGGKLEPHPNERTVPAVQASTGSLGQGLSIGVGLALGSRMCGHNDSCFVILGDGELNEGQCWEAAMSASRLRLGNLVAVVDANGFQQDGPMDEIMPVTGLAEAWRTLGWAAAEVDGHDCAMLLATLAATRSADRPALIVARTVKGRGVPFIEHMTESHFPPPLTAAELVMIDQLAAKGTANARG
ncbi:MULTISPECIES: transketolase [Mesorhizobium]|uniref:Transketolase subunit A n=1 Tax=Mesorhizobium qingshengii TaxID=1165689 RepID=A0A1G5ZX49_9HYPH|nr:MULTISPECIES: transketolase [Mesorhizobium]AID34838.2 transketolase [Mesorhizobium huakuii 7653R]MCH4560998.1 transketolase [Mesorhizobium jarvisii]SDA99275.1 transketolase subunit A [Mesorhizobium qingshengii]